MNDVTCYFHRIDFDGKGSGFLVKSWYEKKGYTVNCIGVNYGDTFYESEVKDKIVVICDFTFEPEQMFGIQALAKTVVWLDHHKTSIDKMDEYMNKNEIKNPFTGLQVIGLAGIELTYLFLYQGFTLSQINEVLADAYRLKHCLPRLVWLLGRYDVWDLKNDCWSDALNLQYGLKQYDMSPEGTYWGLLLNDDTTYACSLHVTEAIKDGQKFREYTDENNRWYLSEYGYEATFKEEYRHLRDLTVYAVNTGFKGSNTFVDRMDKYDVLFAYVHQADGTFGVSVYSATGIDVSEIAAYFKGGGHKGAAGFKCVELPIVKKE